MIKHFDLSHGIISVLELISVLRSRQQAHHFLDWSLHCVIEHAFVAAAQQAPCIISIRCVSEQRLTADCYGAFVENDSVQTKSGSHCDSWTSTSAKVLSSQR